MNVSKVIHHYIGAKALTSVGKAELVGVCDRLLSFKMDRGGILYRPEPEKEFTLILTPISDMTVQQFREWIGQQKFFPCYCEKENNVIFVDNIARWRSWLSRLAHYQKTVGSSPALATI